SLKAELQTCGWPWFGVHAFSLPKPGGPVLQWRTRPMLFLKYLLLTAGSGLLAAAAALVLYDLYCAQRRLQGLGVAEATPVRPIRWHSAGRLVALAWVPLLLGLSIVVVSSGMAGVRVSQISGPRPGTL